MDISNYPLLRKTVRDAECVQVEYKNDDLPDKSSIVREIF